MSDTLHAYAEAIEVVGLSPERQTRLLDHIVSLNEAMPSAEPISPAVARSAAALLAADPVRLSGPTAVAQAEALSRSGKVGPALMQIQASLMVLQELSATPELALTAPHRPALRRILWNLVEETSELLARMG